MIIKFGGAIISKGINWAEAKGKYYYLLEVIRKKLLKELIKEEPNFNTLKSCKISSETLKNLRKEMYQLLDIQEVAEKMENDINLNDDIPEINIIRQSDEVEIELVED